MLTDIITLEISAENRFYISSNSKFRVLSTIITKSETKALIEFDVPLSFFLDKEECVQILISKNENETCTTSITPIYETMDGRTTISLQYQQIAQIHIFPTCAGYEIGRSKLENYYNISTSWLSTNIKVLSDEFCIAEISAKEYYLQ